MTVVTEDFGVKDDGQGITKAEVPLVNPSCMDVLRWITNWIKKAKAGDSVGFRGPSAKEYLSRFA